MTSSDEEKNNQRRCKMVPTFLTLEVCSDCERQGRIRRLTHDLLLQDYRDNQRMTCVQVAAICCKATFDFAALYKYFQWSSRYKQTECTKQKQRTYICAQNKVVKTLFYFWIHPQISVPPASSYHVSALAFTKTGLCTNIQPLLPSPEVWTEGGDCIS